jgi:hypothetical protein
MLAQLTRDLERGFAGCLDALTPRAATDLFASRLSDGDGSWWDAETRGNWLLGYVMAAHLAGHPAHRARAEALVDALAATEDDDGYVGIYDRARRYAHPDGENGELWGQSRALLALIASAEATGAETRLAVVERAVARTMAAYGAGRPYFRAGTDRRRSALGGLTHGLCYGDVLARLAVLTGRSGYGAFGAWLYRDFSSMPLPFPNDDVALGALLTEGRPWTGHAVHTAEHLRALRLACDVEGADDLARAWNEAVRRLGRYTLPSGALIGDESVHDEPSPTCGYEYCTTTELLLSLATALASTGDASYGDRLETLAFNAAQGARLPDGRAVAYLSADTRLEAVAARGDRYSGNEPGRRFKFSPTHDDVACCCNPNAVRLLPSYLGAAWLRLAGRPGLALTAYAPSRLDTLVAGARVRIEQRTSYPFSDEVRLEVAMDGSASFGLWLRVPAWTAGMSVTVSVLGAGPRPERRCAVDETAGSGWCRLERTWQDGDVVEVAFSMRPRVEAYASGERAVLRGPLQFVLPIEDARTAIRDYPVEGFHDLELRPASLQSGAPEAVAEDVAASACVERPRPDDVDDPWANSPIVLQHGATRLVPMGCSLLRVAGLR